MNNKKEMIILRQKRFSISNKENDTLPIAAAGGTFGLGTYGTFKLADRNPRLGLDVTDIRDYKKLKSTIKNLNETNKDDLNKKSKDYLKSLGKGYKEELEYLKKMYPEEYKRKIANSRDALRQKIKEHKFNHNEILSTLSRDDSKRVADLFKYKRDMVKLGKSKLKKKGVLASLAASGLVGMKLRTENKKKDYEDD